MVGRIPYWYHYGKNPQEFDMGIQATLKVTQKSAWFTPVKIWLVVYLPLWKIWKSLGMIILNIWKNKKWSKPPTRNGDVPVRYANVYQMV